MVKIQMKCRCGNSIDARAGDSFCNGTLRWYVSYKCNSCGAVIEEDGIDEIPTEIRNAIIKEKGKFGIFITDRKELIKIICILKKELGFSAEHTKEIKEKFPNELLQGTECEIERVHNILIRKGIVSAVIKKI